MFTAREVVAIGILLSMHSFAAGYFLAHDTTRYLLLAAVVALGGLAQVLVLLLARRRRQHIPYERD